MRASAGPCTCALQSTSERNKLAASGHLLAAFGPAVCHVGGWEEKCRARQAIDECSVTYPHARPCWQRGSTTDPMSTSDTATGMR